IGLDPRLRSGVVRRIDRCAPRTRHDQGGRTTARVHPTLPEGGVVGPAPVDPAPVEAAGGAKSASRPAASVDDAPAWPDAPGSVLKDTIARAVIPNLVRQVRRDSLAPTDSERDLMLRLVLRGERDGAHALLRQCVVAGMRAERLAEDLITPVARHLGVEWERDTCDFVRVTVGLNLLTELMLELRELDPPRPTAARCDVERRSILLAAAPGEHHGIGTLIVADAFERAGWEAVRAEARDGAALMVQVAAQSYDVIGLSVAADRHIAGIAALVTAMRRLSRNPATVMMAGGSAILRRPEIGDALGVDAIALDARHAVEMASALVG
ncbi:MAG: cobalamin-dependent protein, partial [Pseudomonadota bacterium]